MSRLHDFERLIDDRLRSLFRSPAGQGEKREMIEVHRAILDDVAGHIEMLPRGRRAFAYPQLKIQILLPGPERRRAYEVAFVEAGALARDVRGRIEDEGVEIPERFEVEVLLVESLDPAVAVRGFDISYSGAAPVQKAAAVEIPTVWLQVVHGRAERDEYSFRKARITLGRLTDVLDAQQRLIRRNDVAFVESGDGPNPTVSRTHAHLEWDAAGACFRLFDDRSAQGTNVLREGGIVNVPRGLSKGIQLRPGDEIVLGQARVRFEYGVDSDTR